MQKTSIKNQIRRNGILLALLSTFSFCLMQIFVAATGDEISIMEQTFFRNLVGLMIAGVFTKKYHLSFFGERQYRPLLLARSIAGFIAITLL